MATDTDIEGDRGRKMGTDMDVIVDRPRGNASSGHGRSGHRARVPPQLQGGPV